MHCEFFLPNKILISIVSTILRQAWMWVISIVVVLPGYEIWSSSIAFCIEKIFPFIKDLSVSRIFLPLQEVKGTIWRLFWNMAPLWKQGIMKMRITWHHFNVVNTVKHQLGFGTVKRHFKIYNAKENALCYAEVI